MCRSRFEANYCRILKYLGIIYEYEPKAFKLSNGKRYLPDLYLIKEKEYRELKGYMREDDKNKIELFRKEYPNIRFKIVMQCSNEWKILENKYKNKIKEWEKM